MKKLLDYHFTKVELVSFLQTFVSVAVIDVAMEWDVILSGDWSTTALLAFAVAVSRSALKAIILLTKKSS